MTTNNHLFEELSFYTLSHPDADYFIHQLVVDAYTAQNVTEHTKRISLFFSLVGLYLLNEKKYTGKQIQRAHTLLSRHKNDIPEVVLPVKRGDVTIVEVLESKSNRDEMIKKWCASVWAEYKMNKETIKCYCDKYLFSV